MAWINKIDPAARNSLLNGANDYRREFVSYCFQKSFNVAPNQRQLDIIWKLIEIAEAGKKMTLTELINRTRISIEELDAVFPDRLPDVIDFVEAYVFERDNICNVA